MGRRARYTDEQIISAAQAIVSRDGPAAATIGAIGAALGGAPSGSLYHRFASRPELLGRLWLRTAASFQDQFVGAMTEPDAVLAGLNAALSLPRRVRADPAGARIMLIHRREDFLSDQWPPEMRREARRLKEQVDLALADLAHRLFGAGDRSLRATAFAVLDIPFAAVRRHVAANETPPDSIDVLVEAAYRAVVACFRASQLSPEAKSNAHPRRAATRPSKSNRKG